MKASSLLVLFGALVFFAPLSRPLDAQVTDRGGRVEKSGANAVAVLGGGCFWCLEAVFELVPGVIDVENGYAGGKRLNPTYEEVSTGATGHAEVVRITFDPAKVSYAHLLDYFWKVHNPTTLDRQGADVGSQYRSVIFFADEGQRVAAQAAIAGIAKTYNDPIVTELLPLPRFYVAEDYHQDYFRKHPDAGYCRVVIAPKVKKAGF